MEQIIELIPLIMFLIAYKIQGVYVATAVLMLATSLQSLYLYIKNKKLTAMQWVTLLLVIIFGGMTLFFKDERFIKLKPTILYWGIAIALEFSWRYMKNNLAKKILQPVLEKTEIIITDAKIWQKAHHFCAAFMWSLGLLNLIIAYSYSMNTWVTLKVFGFPFITFIAIAGLMYWLYKNKQNI
jgi:intracellular septation protein